MIKLINHPITLVTMFILLLIGIGLIGQSAPVRVHRTVNVKVRIDADGTYVDIEDRNTTVDSRDTIISFLKESEGFRPVPYFCPAGKRTIGYGHVISEKEEANLKFVTPQQAEAILTKDLDQRIDYIKQKLPNISDTKVCALAAFAFNVGNGNFNRSTLKKLIAENKKGVEKEWLKWIHYRSKGRLLISSHLLKRRKFELEIYQNG